jgi:hypothetical protein
MRKHRMLACTGRRYDVFLWLLVKWMVRRRAARHQIGTRAGFGSEQVAGFKLECMAGFIGIRSPSAVRSTGSPRADTRACK